MGTQIVVKKPLLIKLIKSKLEISDALDKSRKISKKDGNALLYSTASVSELSTLLREYEKEISMTEDDSRPIERKTHLRDEVADIIGEYHNELLATVPKKWSLYPPMVLFNNGTFDTPDWANYFLKNGTTLLFDHLLDSFFKGYTHYAVNKPIIEEDVMRRPFSLVPLHGDFGPEPTTQMFESPLGLDIERTFWCTVTQNGISQEWAPRYTMFSRGNITEKKRLLDSYRNLTGENVVDLYAGIGYFTLSYLANGATVYCWEINPWSIEGLLRGLKKNGCKFCLIKDGDNFDATTHSEALGSGVNAFVFHESNEHAVERLSRLDLAIAHYNLGLLPTLRQGWEVVRRLESHKSKGPKVLPALVHAHENVHKNDFDQIVKEIETFFDGRVIQLNKVKTFAPDIWHIVLDVQLQI